MSKKVISAEYVNLCAILFALSPACEGGIIKNWDHKTWRNDYKLKIKIGWSDGTFTYLEIPRHTETDGSSVPFPLNALIPAIGPNAFAALAHDEIYRNKHVDITCGQADDIYMYLAGKHGALAHGGLRLWNFVWGSNPNYVERAK